LEFQNGAQWARFWIVIDSLRHEDIAKGNSACENLLGGDAPAPSTRFAVPEEFS
jgi:hypothetical protein